MKDVNEEAAGSNAMETEQALAALAALAQPSRLALFRLLVEQGTAGLAAGAIGERLGVPAPTLSFHLNRLRQAGLVRSTRRERSIVYAADYQRIQALIGFLLENCCRAGDCAPVQIGPTNPTPKTRKRSMQ